MTGANEKLGLPRDKMKKVVIAFDVDGTLRCNCTPTCRDVNDDMFDLLNILRRMKNTKIIVWSGGGADYARSFMSPFDIPGLTYASKLNYYMQHGKPDIAIDDIQDTGLGTFNLICKEK